MPRTSSTNSRPQPSFFATTIILLTYVSLMHQANAVSLADFAPYATSLSPPCSSVYVSPLPSCSASDFVALSPKSGSSCSPHCIDTLVALSYEIYAACGRNPQNEKGNTLVKAFLEGQGIEAVCPNVLVSTSTPSKKPTTTRSATSATNHAPENTSGNIPPGLVNWASGTTLPPWPTGPLTSLVEASMSEAPVQSFSSAMGDNTHPTSHGLAVPTSAGNPHGYTFEASNPSYNPMSSITTITSSLTTSSEFTMVLQPGNESPTAATSTTVSSSSGSSGCTNTQGSMPMDDSSCTNSAPLLQAIRGWLIGTLLFGVTVITRHGFF